MSLIGLSGKIKSGKDTFASMLQLVIAEKKPLRSVEQLQERFKLYDIVLGLKPYSTWKIKKFASILKQIVALLTGCTIKQLEDQDFKEQELPEMWDRTIKEARAFIIMKHWFDNKNESELGHLDDKEVYKRALADGFKFKRTYREMLQEIGTNVMREHFHPKVWVNALMSQYQLVKEDRHWTGHAISMEDTMTDKYPKWIITDTRFPDEAEAIKSRNGIVIRINRNGSDTSNHASETALDNYQHFDEVIDNNGTLFDLYQHALRIVNKYNLKT